MVPNISSKDHLFIAIDRSSSTYERNISLQIYSTIYDFSYSLRGKIDICCFDTEINNFKINLNSKQVRLYADKYLRPLPPPPVKGLGKGTNLSLAILTVTNNIIQLMSIYKNKRVVGIIFTDDESYRFRPSNVFTTAKDNCQKIKQLGGELIIIQMLPSNNYPNSKQLLTDRFNLNPNQVISFVDDSAQSLEIYKICSRSLQILNSNQSQKSFSVSDNLNHQLLLDNSSNRPTNFLEKSKNYYFDKLMSYFNFKK